MLLLFENILVKFPVVMFLIKLNLFQAKDIQGSLCANETLCTNETNLMLNISQTNCDTAKIFDLKYNIGAY